MKKSFYVLFILSLSLLVLNSCTSVSGDENIKEKPSIKLVKAIHPKTIEKNLELNFTANILSKNTSSLSTKVGGRIENIFYEVGDYVKKGDVIAKLSAEEQNISNKSSKLNYQNNLVNLSNTRNLMQSQINIAKANIKTLESEIKKLKSSKENLEKTMSNKVEIAENQVDLINLKIESINKKTDQNLKHLNEQKYNLISQSIILLNSSMDSAYHILRVDRDALAIKLEIPRIFGQKNQQLRIDIASKLRSNNKSIKDFEKLYLDFKNSKSNFLIDDIFNQNKVILKETKDTMDLLHELLVNTVTDKNLSDEQLMALINFTNTYRSKISDLLLSVSAGVPVGIQALNQSNENLDLEKDLNLKQANKSLEVAKNNLNLTKNSKTQEIDNLSNQLLVLKDQLETANANLKSSEANLKMQVQLLKTQLDASKTQVEMSEANLENTLIRAPYDGVITKKYFDNGVVIAPGTVVLEIADYKNLKLAVMVDEDKIDDIYIGQNAEFTIDYIKDKVFKTNVSRISNNSDLVSRKVLVEFDLEDYLNVKINSFARLKIILNDTKKEIFIPKTAVLNISNINNVFVIKNNILELEPVQLLELKDEFLVEKGLSDSDLIVADNLKSLKNKDLVKYEFLNK